MRTAAMFSALLIAGCSTTTAGHLSRPPQHSWPSTKAMPELEQCLARGLSWISNPSVVHGPEETTLSWSSAGNTYFVLTLRPSDAGSLIEARSQFGLGGRMRRSIETCL